MGNKKREISSKIVKTKESRLFLYLFLLVLIPFTLYFRSVSFGFSGLDDQDIISATYKISSNQNPIKEAFAHDAFMSNSGAAYYRPVQTLSFLLDAELGGVNPWVYHLSNLILYIITVVALFFFLKKIGFKEEISFLLSMFFAINPLLANAVAWIPARGDILLGLFGLLSFLLMLIYFENHRPVYFLLHALFYFLTVFSKESAFFLPVFILIYLYFIKKKKVNIKEIIPCILVWSIALLLFYILRQSVVRDNSNQLYFGLIPFIKNLPVIPIIFGKFFVPLNLSTLPRYDIISLIIGIILLVLFTAIIVVYSKNQKRIIIWGAIWFLAFILPSMLFRLNSADFGFEYFEYRAYLPVIGILILLGSLANRIPSGYSFNKILKIITPLFIIYGMISYMHSAAFSDPLSFFTSGIDANPLNAAALNSRGGIYRGEGSVQLALTDYTNATKICSTYSSPYLGTGDLYRNLGENIQALKFYSQALKYDTLYKDINNLHDNAYLSLSAMNIVMNKYDDALLILRKGAVKYPGSNKIFNNLGYVYYGLGKNDSAKVCFNKAIEISPKEAAYYSNRAKAEYRLKEYDKSLIDYNMSLSLDPNYMDAYLNRGMLKIDMNDYGGSISDLTTTISLNSESGEAFHYLGTAYSRINKQVEAEKCWAEARKLGFKETTDLNSKADSNSKK